MFVYSIGSFLVRSSSKPACKVGNKNSKKKKKKLKLTLIHKHRHYHTLLNQIKLVMH
jgi:hypothetical protein